MDECLNENLFGNYRHAQKVIEDWRIDYNLYRPQTSLDEFTLNEFIARSTMNNNVNSANL